MTPREFLDQVVRPNVADQKAAYGDFRKAYNAIHAVDALAAHIFVWCQAKAPQLVAGLASDGAYRGRLRARSPDFQLVSDAAKAGKHVALTLQPSTVKKADQVTPRVMAYGVGPYGPARYSAGEQVWIELADGSLRSVESLLERAIAFLEAEMAAAKIPRRVAASRPRIPPRPGTRGGVTSD